MTVDPEMMFLLAGQTLIELIPTINATLMRFHLLDVGTGFIHVLGKFMYLMIKLKLLTKTYYITEGGGSESNGDEDYDVEYSAILSREGH